MTVQFSVAVRNARLDAVETTIGTTPVLKIFEGSIPANCAAADAGTVLASMTLPSDWLAAASSGAKALSGTWSDASANASGTAQYYRIYASDGTTCHEQGTITATGDGGDVTVASTTIVATQAITVTSKTQTDGNA